MQAICRSMAPMLAALFFVVWLLIPHAYADVQDDIEQCDSCHGSDGVSIESDVPTIAGVSPFIIEEYMFEYRDDARP